MRMPHDAHRRTPAAVRIYSCIVSRGGHPPLPAGDNGGAGRRRIPRPADLGRRHVACCGAVRGTRPGDVGVAANVLVTVTSAPFEV